MSFPKPAVTHPRLLFAAAAFMPLVVSVLYLAEAHFTLVGVSHDPHEDAHDYEFAFMVVVLFWLLVPVNLLLAIPGYLWWRNRVVWWVTRIALTLTTLFPLAILTQDGVDALRHAHAWGPAWLFACGIDLVAAAALALPLAMLWGHSGAPGHGSTPSPTSDEAPGGGPDPNGRRHG